MAQSSGTTDSSPVESTSTTNRGIKPASNNLEKARAASSARAFEKTVTQFETDFGRKLTEDQRAQLRIALAERAAAQRAAQEQYNTRFSQITGVSQDEIKARKRELAKQRRDAKKTARAGAAKSATAPPTTQ
jgi:hypothetical protein